MPSGGGGAAAAPASGGGAAPAAAEAKEEEKKEEKVRTLISAYGPHLTPFLPDAGRVRRRYGLRFVRLGYSCTKVISPVPAPRFSDARWSALRRVEITCCRILRFRIQNCRTFPTDKRRGTKASSAFGPVVHHMHCNLAVWLLWRPSSFNLDAVSQWSVVLGTATARVLLLFGYEHCLSSWRRSEWSSRA